jgi:hypothetical protein
MAPDDTSATTAQPDDGQDEYEGSTTQSTPSDDESGKPTIDEPTGPALDPEPDEFDKQAEDA